MTQQRPLGYFALLLLLWSFNSVYSQNATKQTDAKPTTVGVTETVFDQYGKQYAISDLLVKKSSSIPPSCSAGSYFNLFFEAGCGMDDASNPTHAARRAVVCQVFEDLSSFINSPLTTTGNKVNIWVRNINNVTTTPNGVLGMASGFYMLPSNPTFGGIADNEIWKTMHTGYDSYQNTAAPLALINSGGGQSGLLYHGMMTFNFNTNNTPVINFHTDLTTATVPAGYYDLYSAVLHEMTHALGFASLIDANGNPVFGPNYKYYSRYDRFLKTNNSAQFLITSSGCSNMYDYNFNPALSNTVLHPNPLGVACSSTTLCNDALKYVGGSTVPIHTPNCFNPISSLSHFEDAVYPNCTSPYGNDSYFLMCNAGNPGTMRRYFKPEERIALCDMGYHVKNTFGSTATVNGYYNYGSLNNCKGSSVAGRNDGINTDGTYAYIGDQSTNITIAGSVILGNDTAATGFECLQDLTATSGFPTTLSATTGTTATTVTFNSGAPGLHLLRYVPTRGTSRGNISYVYVYVRPVIAGCTVTPSSCNMVVNGRYEQNTVDVTNASTFGADDAVCGWQRRGFHTTYYLQNGTNMQYNVPCNLHGSQSDQISGNIAYTGILAYSGSNNTTNTKSMWATRLTSVLQPNTTYSISFNVSQAEFFRFRNYRLQAFVTSVNPTAVTGAGFTAAQLTNGTLLTNATYSSNSNGWETITLPFTTTATQTNLEYLYIGIIDNQLCEVGAAAGTVAGCPDNFNFYPEAGSVYYLDNVSMIATGGATFSLPALACGAPTLNNLTAYLSGVVTTGTFAGPGVASSGGVFSFNAGLAGAGTHTISYTYNNNIGCPVTLTSTITVSGTFPYTLNAVNDDFTSTPINYVTGGSTPSVFSNDLYNGALFTPATMPNVTLSIVSSTIPGATIAANGVITLPATGMTGVNTIVYQMASSNCRQISTATVTVYLAKPFAATPNISGTTRANNSVNLLDFHSSDRIVIGGSFTTYAGVARNRIARIKSDFTLDTSFNSAGGTPASQGPRDLVTVGSDKTFVVGGFTGFSGGSNGYGLAMLNSDGSLDTAFNVGGTGFNTGGYAFACDLTGSNRLWVGGMMSSYNGTATGVVVRLNANGSLDTTFSFPYNAASGSWVSKMQKAGVDLFAAGEFYSSGSLPNNVNLIKVFSNGTIDNSFTPGALTTTGSTNCASCVGGHAINGIVNQADGKLIVYGAFSSYNGTACTNIVRLYADGSIDTSFNAFASTDRAITDVSIDPLNGKLVVSGEFTSFNGTAVSKMIRLQNNGALDTTFSLGTGTADTGGTGMTFNNVYVIERQNDGKIIVGGRFTSVNGQTAGNLTRIYGDYGLQAKGIQMFRSEPEAAIMDLGSKLKVYPNPSRDVFYFEQQDVLMHYTDITVYNMLGMQVYRADWKTDEVNSIDLGAFPTGSYIARINGEQPAEVKILKN